MRPSDMADAEESVSEKAALADRQTCNSRFLLRQSWWRGPQRHLVAIMQNCSMRWHCLQDDLFNLYLRVFFLIILGLGVIRILLELPITRIPFPGGSWSSAVEQIHRTWMFLHVKGTMFLAVFTVVFAIRVLMKMKKKYDASSPQPKEEVETVSGLIRHV